jgi:FkbM family methyltransferase
MAALTLFSRAKKLVPEPIKNVYRSGRYRIPIMLRSRFRDDPSQAGEITLLRRLIGADWPKALVDVGANDGYCLSNTYPFVRDGWKALLVEPHPKTFERLRKIHAKHPNAVCERVACGNQPGTAELYMSPKDPDGIGSTICTDDNNFVRQAKANASRVTIVVETLATLLDRQQFPADFSLLSVDAEGVDYEVLAGLDWSRYRPRLVITEEYNLTPEKFAARNRLFEQHRYRMMQIIGCNSLWAAN